MWFTRAHQYSHMGCTHVWLSLQMKTLRKGMSEGRSQSSEPGQVCPEGHVPDQSAALLPEHCRRPVAWVGGTASSSRRFPVQKSQLDSQRPERAGPCSQLVVARRDCPGCPIPGQALPPGQPGSPVWTNDSGVCVYRLLCWPSSWTGPHSSIAFGHAQSTLQHAVIPRNSGLNVPTRDNFVRLALLLLA